MRIEQGGNFSSRSGTHYFSAWQRKLEIIGIDADRTLSRILHYDLQRQDAYRKHIAAEDRLLPVGLNVGINAD